MPSNASADALRIQFGDPPSLAIVLGSGAGGIVDRIAEARAVPYPELGLPSSAVEGHAGVAHVGRLQGKRVAVMAGRVHLYEGHAPETVAALVRAVRAWGVREVVLTSAVGSLDRFLPPGSILRVTDHINLTARNPLMGPHDPSLGARFVDVTTLYSPAMGTRAHEAAASIGLALHDGVYAGMLGPSYETAAEVRMLGMLGARVVGMSVVTEALAAAQIGLDVLALSIVSNLGTGLSPEPLSHEEVTRVVGAAVGRLGDLLEAFVVRS
jgi:inosine/guanosine/xanthosine phosphorylase family protein